VNEVQSFLLEDVGIRGALVRLSETWQHVVAHHAYPPDLERLLGEGVAATVLLATGLKHQPKVSLQLQGEGPLRLLLVQCSGELAVRAMAQWRDYAAGDSLLGGGRLAVNLDTGARWGLFQGIVPLVGDRLETCLEAYFDRSEQLPTRLLLTCAGDTVAGLLLQTLPSEPADSEHAAALAALAGGVQRDLLFDAPAETLLPALFDRQRIRLFEAQPVSHDCRCTPEHLANVARLLGEEELNSLLEERGHVELTCEFCNRRFRYDAAGVRAILRGDAPPGRLH
jgi:molecular chaperone Hsp33